MSYPVAYPPASSRTPGETYGQAMFRATRPVTDLPFGSSFSLLAGGEAGR